MVGLHFDSKKTGNFVKDLLRNSVFSQTKVKPKYCCHLIQNFHILTSSCFGSSSTSSGSLQRYIWYCRTHYNRTKEELGDTQQLTTQQNVSRDMLQQTIRVSLRFEKRLNFSIKTRKPLIFYRPFSSRSEALQTTQKKRSKLVKETGSYKCPGWGVHKPAHYSAWGEGVKMKHLWNRERGRGRGGGGKTKEISMETISAGVLITNQNSYHLWNTEGTF